MDRIINYPGQIPLDTDLLATSQNTMIALGMMMQAMFGQNTVADGLQCTANSPTTWYVNIAPGLITTYTTVEPNTYGSLLTNTSQSVMKMGINLNSLSFGPLSTPATGANRYYLFYASFNEADASALVLPYYNSANPASPYSGPGGLGTSQNTRRTQTVNVQSTYSDSAIPAVPTGCVGLWVVTVPTGATSILSTYISEYPNSPFIKFRLQQMRPGVSSAVQTFGSASSSGSYSFTVPQGVTTIEAEVWGAGSGSWASVSGLPGGGGSGGGYAKKLFTGLTPGSTVTITVGAGGSGGTSSVNPGAGGNSTVTAGGVTITGGGASYNTVNTLSAPQFGNRGGHGTGGDLNLYGGDGGNGGDGAGASGTTGGNYGGFGGDGPLSGGTINVGASAGNAGNFPGGGASGAGTGSAGTSANTGAAGANGYVIIRY